MGVLILSQSRRCLITMSLLIVDRLSCVPEGRRHASMHMVCVVYGVHVQDTSATTDHEFVKPPTLATPYDSVLCVRRVPHIPRLTCG